MICLPSGEISKPPAALAEGPMSTTPRWVRLCVDKSKTSNWAWVKALFRSHSELPRKPKSSDSGLSATRTSFSPVKALLQIAYHDSSRETCHQDSQIHPNHHSL